MAAGARLCIAGWPDADFEQICIKFMASLNLIFLKVRRLKLTRFMGGHFKSAAFYGFLVAMSTNIGLTGYFVK